MGDQLDNQMAMLKPIPGASQIWYCKFGRKQALRKVLITQLTGKVIAVKEVFDGAVFGGEEVYERTYVTAIERADQPRK